MRTTKIGLKSALFVSGWEDAAMYRSAKPLEELALDLLFESYGESRYNRTPSEYAHLSALVTNLKDAEYRVNKLLKEKKESGRLRWMGICYFQPNDLPHRPSARLDFDRNDP